MKEQETAVFENRMLERMFGRKWETVTGENF
jgi:hypothetical protein